MNAMNNPSLIDYAEKNDVESLKRLLNSHVNINQLEYGRSALQAACISNSIQAAELLIDKGINVNLRDLNTGATALHYCGLYNCYVIAEHVIGRNGKLDIIDNYGNQPLWTAVFNVKGKLERLQLVELFLKNRANKNHKNNAGRSPLDFANQVKYEPLLKLLNAY